MRGRTTSTPRSRAIAGSPLRPYCRRKGDQLGRGTLGTWLVHAAQCGGRFWHLCTSAALRPLDAFGSGRRREARAASGMLAALLISIHLVLLCSFSVLLLPGFCVVSRCPRFLRCRGKKNVLPRCSGRASRRSVLTRSCRLQLPFAFWALAGRGRACLEWLSMRGGPDEGLERPSCGSWPANSCQQLEVHRLGRRRESVR